MTDENRTYLPYGRQFVDEDDIQAVTDVLRGDWLTTGPTIQKFEDTFKTLIQSDYFISCSSGTAALHLACLALGIGPGDRVIVPAISFVATANGARYCGADVLFSDVDPATGLMRAQDVLSLIEELTPDELKSVTAILPVNLTGEIAEIEAISAIAKARGWKVIIDSCHAVGTRYQDEAGQSHTVGDCHFSDMEVFSFHPVKTIAMGEGGGVATQDSQLHEKLMLLRNHGMQRDPEKWQEQNPRSAPEPWYYEMQMLGYNYRQSDIHCALGLSQLKKLPLFLEKRRDLVACYDDLLSGLSPHIKPLPGIKGCRAARHLYVLLIDFEAEGISRLEFVKALAARNVGTQVHYIPIYRHPYYQKMYGRLSRPGAAQYYARTISLPLHVAMTREDVAYVVGQVSEVLRGGE